MEKKVEMEINNIETMRIVLEELNPLGSFKAVSGIICGNVLMENLELPKGWRYYTMEGTTFGEIKKIDEDQLFNCCSYEYWL